MDCLQPGLSFRPVCRAKISTRLKTKIAVKFSKRLHPGFKLHGKKLGVED